MKIANQLSIAWIQKEGRSRDQLLPTQPVDQLACRIRGFDDIAALTYTSTTAAETVCKWCPINCTRTFIDVQLPGAKGRPWSKLPLAPGWERVISGNSCPKGLVEDVNELREVKAKLEETKRDYPNVAEMVRKDAFRRSRPTAPAVAE